LRFADEIDKRYWEIEYSGGKVLQSWRGSGGNWDLHLTFTHLIY